MPHDSEHAWRESEPDDECPSGAEEETLVRCSDCHAEFYDVLGYCPRCGAELEEQDTRSGVKPWWVVVGVLICLALAVVTSFAF